MYYISMPLLGIKIFWNTITKSYQKFWDSISIICICLLSNFRKQLYMIVRLYKGNFGNLYHIHAKNPSQSHSVFSSCMSTHWACVNDKPTMSKLHTPSYHINSLKLSRKFPLQRVGSELSWGLEVNWHPNELLSSWCDYGGLISQVLIEPSGI